MALLPDSLVGSTARMCLDKAVILVSRVIKHKEISNGTIVELFKFTLVGLPPSKRRYRGDSGPTFRLFGRLCKLPRQVSTYPY